MQEKMTNHHQYFEANRNAWNLRTDIHLNSEFYNVEAWKNGGTSLNSIEINEMGDVSGKKLLHLQCHFGQDTLSWARLGADVTGCDLSDKAVEYARQLAKEMNLPAQFVCCNLYDLPKQLEGTFDIVFTSYGTVGWLPDLKPWAEVINHFLKPGGFFYIADFHPVMWMFDEKMEYFKYPYHNSGVIETEQVGTYADRYSSGRSTTSSSITALNTNSSPSIPSIPTSIQTDSARTGDWRMAPLSKLWALPLTLSTWPRPNEK